MYSCPCRSLNLQKHGHEYMPMPHDNLLLRRRRTMKRFWLTALALSAGLTTSTFAEITGKVTFDGQAPERKPLAGVATDPNCGKMHKTPLLEETIIVGKGGELANCV